MKKILLFASALAGLFLAGSCQKETLEPAAQGGVTYEITLPDGPQTKGEAGYELYDLHYEVYRINGTAIDKLYHNRVDMPKEGLNIPLDLLNDQTYTVIFWAQEKGSPWIDASDLQNIQLKESLSNNDQRDAFCAVDANFSHDGTQSRKVTLTRPFAQVNIATTVNNVGYDITPKQSLVTFKNIPTGYNLLKGETNATTEVTFGLNGIPGNAITVNGTTYTNVAMNYVLVADSNIDEVYYEIQTNNGTVKNTIPSVPVKKNYRTNIIGNLLTSNATYTIEVKPGFEDGDFYGPEFVKTPAYDEETKTWTITCRDELLYVAQQVNTGANSFVGQTVKVVNDIDLKNMSWTPIGKSTSVAFNGMFEGVAVTKSATDNPTISNLKIENGNCSGFFGILCNGGMVRNINFANVTISGERQLGVVAGQVYGNLQQPTIEDVTVENVTITAVPAFDGTTYDNGDKVGGIAGLIGQQAYIKGCTVKNATFTGYRDMGGIVGCTQNGYSCNLSGNHSENIDFVVTSQYVPYNGNTPHGATGAIRGGTRSSANDVIEGNTSAEVSEVVLVNDAVNLQNAITAAAGETHIKFENNIVGNVLVVQKLGVNIIIDGNDQEFDGTFILEGGSQGNSTETLKFQNINFKHEETGEIYFIDANSADVAKRYVHNVTVDNCTFTGSADAVALRFRQAYNLTVSNTSVVSGHSLLQAYGTIGIVIDNVEVEAGRGVSLGSSTGVTIKDSEFKVASYGVRGNGDGNSYDINIAVKDSEIEANQPIVIRKVTDANHTYAISFTGTTLKALSEDGYQVVLTNGADDAEYVKPTGTYTLTGADSFKLFPAIPVAKIGNAEYTSIDEAIANWTNGTTLTLIANVTLNNVITLKSTEYHVLDLGTYTMTAAKGKDAISITAEGRSSASYALDIKADANNPGGITATSKAVVKTTGKSGVKDRPIIRFYNGIYNASNVISHSGSNGTNCPQFQFHGGVYNASLSANRALIQIYGGTFNGRFYISVDSSAYALISGGKFKYLDNLYGSALNSDKFTIGSSKGNFDRGVYVDDEGYIVVGGAVITEFGDMFAAKATNASKAGSYLPYSSAAEHGLYYTNAPAAIAKHGEANVVLK